MPSIEAYKRKFKDWDRKKLRELWWEAIIKVSLSGLSDANAYHQRVAVEEILVSEGTPPWEDSLWT